MQRVHWCGMARSVLCFWLLLTALVGQSFGQVRFVPSTICFMTWALMYSCYSGDFLQGSMHAVLGLCMYASWHNAHEYRWVADFWFRSSESCIQIYKDLLKVKMDSCEQTHSIHLLRVCFLTQGSHVWRVDPCLFQENSNLLQRPMQAVHGLTQANSLHCAETRLRCIGEQRFLCWEKLSYKHIDLLGNMEAVCIQQVHTRSLTQGLNMVWLTSPCFGMMFYIDLCRLCVNSS